jgi:hypothetical protein
MQLGKMQQGTCLAVETLPVANDLNSDLPVGSVIQAVQHLQCMREYPVKLVEFSVLTS